MSNERKWAGRLLVGASLGLSVISGNASYYGIEAQVPQMPVLAFAGFVIALAVIGLGFGLGSEITSSRWLSAVAFAAFLTGAAFMDGSTNDLAIQSQVQTADQTAADRNAKYDAAVRGLKRSEDLIKKLSAEQTLMQARDKDGIQAAQRLLVSQGKEIGPFGADGVYGGDTEKAMIAYGEKLAADLDTERAKVEAYEATIAGGTVVAEAALDTQTGRVLAYGITVLSIILSFAGGILSGGTESLRIREAKIANDNAEIARRKEGIDLLTEATREKIEALRRASA